MKWIDKYDSTGLVPHYTHANQVPGHLRKYFSQRERYFSLYSTSPGCLLDEEGWYSVTPERLADQIAERCRCDTIVDAFCGVGGNAIAFAKTCQRVIALDTSPTRLALARHNAQIYGVADRIEFILADYLTFIKSYLSLPSTSAQKSGVSNNARKIDVVFLSPPWGGPSYLSGSPKGSPPKDDLSSSTQVAEHPPYSLGSIQPIHGAELFDLTRRVTHNIAFYLPRNTRLDEISSLLSDEQRRTGRVTSTSSEMEKIEVEEEWMGNKLKAITCYFGGLVQGQEGIF
ncbi:hypothetical protein M413DRAFT_447032 [Hebeloma cylindrosporum]|uniref:Trimethylguanosine synthase n=1 Tax=Hebeloma cylindrosporum TaxID=76867 RepID=A0A0C3C7I7_HEBCY|nr:hypothetical protein M413DRAFT_447032 [Hebeloma cylindrosporum h7]